ncbi:MAG: flagellar hook-length control protein FliK [Pseudomonadota bacterium]
MNALNLPASLLPARPDGSQLTAVTTTDDPTQLALFEQVFGLTLPSAKPVQGAPVQMSALTQSPVPTLDLPPMASPAQLQSAAQNTVSFALPDGSVQTITVTPAVVKPLTANAPAIERTPLTSSSPLVPAAIVPTETTTLTAAPAAKPQEIALTSQIEISASVETRAIDVTKPTSDAPSLSTQPLVKAFPGDGPTQLNAAPTVNLEKATAQVSTVVVEPAPSPLLANAETTMTTATAAPVKAMIAANPAIEPQAMTQIRDMIRTGSRAGTIEVQLDPPELGRVLIELEVGRQGQVKAVISASESDTLDLMRRNADTLAGDLKDSGFDDVELDWHRTDQSPDGREQPEPHWLLDDTTTLATSTPTSSRHSGALDIQL